MFSKLAPLLVALLAHHFTMASSAAVYGPGYGNFRYWPYLLTRQGFYGHPYYYPSIDQAVQDSVPIDESKLLYDSLLRDSNITTYLSPYAKQLLVEGSVSVNPFGVTTSTLTSTVTSTTTTTSTSTSTIFCIPSTDFISLPPTTCGVALRTRRALERGLLGDDFVRDQIVPSLTLTFEPSVSSFLNADKHDVKELSFTDKVAPSPFTIESSIIDSMNLESAGLNRQNRQVLSFITPAFNALFNIINRIVYAIVTITVNATVTVSTTVTITASVELGSSSLSCLPPLYVVCTP